MLWDPFLYCINDSIQGNSETGNKVFVLPSKVAINNKCQFTNRKLICTFYLIITILAGTGTHSFSRINLMKHFQNIFRQASNLKYLSKIGLTFLIKHPKEAT